MTKIAYAEVQPKTVPEKTDEPETKYKYLGKKLTVLFSFILTVIFNVLSTVGAFGATNGELSDKYSTLITPPGYAFSIWGLIYFFWAAFVLLQFVPNRFLSQPEIFYENSWKGFIAYFFNW